MHITTFIENFKTANSSDILKTFTGQKDILEGLGDNLQLLESTAHLDIQQLLTNRWSQSDKLFKISRAGLPSGINMNTIYKGVISSNIQMLDLLIKDFASGPKVIAKETITVREVNGLMVASNIELWVDYFTLLMDLTSDLMTSTGNKKLEQIAQKPDREFLENYLEQFGEITQLMFAKNDVIMKRYKGLPKLVADQDTIDVLEASKGKDSVNIMVLNRASYHTFNPTYYWDLAKMEINLKRVESAQLQIENTASKISYYQDLQRQDPNPANEKMIELLRDRIIKAKQTIDDIRSQYE